MFVSEPLHPSETKLPPEGKLPVDFTAILVAQCQAASPTGVVDKLTLRLAICFAQALNALMLLLHRWREGLVPPDHKLSQRPPAKAPAKSQPPVKHPSNVALPRRVAGLPQRQPETAIFAEQLQQPLADPEVADRFAHARKHQIQRRRPRAQQRRAKPAHNTHPQQPSRHPRCRATRAATAPSRPPMFLNRKSDPTFARAFRYAIETK